MFTFSTILPSYDKVRKIKRRENTLVINKDEIDGTTESTI